LDPNELVIGFRQTKDPIKGCGYIYEALERLEIPYPVQLLAVGSESDLPDAIKKKYRYVSLPWLDEPDMLAYFRALDIFLMPSLAETFGLMSIEAMACETALICFQSTVLESVTNAPDYGIAVDTSDCGRADRADQASGRIDRQKAKGKRICCSELSL